MATGTATHVLIGQTLADLRKRAGLSVSEAARRGDMAQSKLSKMEHARKRDIDEADIRRLCLVYDALPGEREQLLDLLQSLRDASHLSRVTMSRGAAKFQLRLKQLESRSRLLRSFQPAMVIGLVQAPGYMRAVFQEALSGDDLEAAIEARLARTESAFGDLAKDSTLIMSEGALRWQVGSPAVMVAQMEHLAEVSRRPNVRLGIVPWTTSMTVTCTHGFHLYDSMAVVYGSEVASGVLEAPEDIAVYEQLFARIEERASFDDDARRELARIGNDYRLLGGR